MKLSKTNILLAAFVTAVCLLYLDYYGYIWHNAPFAYFYSVKGLDVSHHQGEIDWAKVAATQKYSFVYIKATEGHDFTDDRFLANFQGAQAVGLKVGAYHFFSMRSSGSEQAELFIKQVPKIDAALPPVIDIEISLEHDSELVTQEVRSFSKKLEDHYGKKPILYVTYDTFYAYIDGGFFDHKIWIRDVYKPPYLPERDWTIWQYSNRGRVDGISTFVDINVLRGSLEEL